MLGGDYCIFICVSVIKIKNAPLEVIFLYVSILSNKASRPQCNSILLPFGKTPPAHFYLFPLDVALLSFSCGISEKKFSGLTSASDF